MVYVCLQAAVMDLVDSDKQRGLAVPVWNTYSGLLFEAGVEVTQHFQPIKRKKNQ